MTDIFKTILDFVSIILHQLLQNRFLKLLSNHLKHVRYRRDIDVDIARNLENLMYGLFS